MTTTETRPALALSIKGTHAVVSGVRFTWSLRCFRCRAVTYISADGGRERTGLNVSHSRKTVRWYFKPEPPAMPARPAECACGETDRPFAFMAGETERSALSENAALGLLNDAYAAIRAQFPDLVKCADEAMARETARCAS